ncbi:hypothetical protein AB1Y20_018737 [Prymnesium parvum]|uniref:Uncharacterized protein n=1 Tax=Prymnesium parvum TaxID=97485 RepID=A0AB34JPJ3_PRYPA
MRAARRCLACRGVARRADTPSPPSLTSTISPHVHAIVQATSSFYPPRSSPLISFSFLAAGPTDMGCFQIPSCKEK